MGGVELTVDVALSARRVAGRGIPFGQRTVYVVSENAKGSRMTPLEWRFYSKKMAMAFCRFRRDWNQRMLESVVRAHESYRALQEQESG